jgi:hypothetical protein
MAGAPEGNQNRAKQYRIQRTLLKILEERGGSDAVVGLEKACRALLDKAEDGDVQAFREVADRIDGKPAQALTVGNEDDKPFVVEKIVREIVRSPDSNG